MSAAEGLVGYGWWEDYTAELRTAMRRWVQEVLLRDPHMTNLAADRLIASLSPSKIDDLARRAYLGLPATDF